MLKKIPKLETIIHKNKTCDDCGGANSIVINKSQTLGPTEVSVAKKMYGYEYGVYTYRCNTCGRIKKARPDGSHE